MNHQLITVNGYDKKHSLFQCCRGTECMNEGVNSLLSFLTF